MIGKQNNEYSLRERMPIPVSFQKPCIDASLNWQGFRRSVLLMHRIDFGFSSASRTGIYICVNMNKETYLHFSRINP